MKVTLKIEVDSEGKLRLLIRVAEEMDIAVHASPLMDECAVLSEISLAKDWNSPEDARWDAS